MVDGQIAPEEKAKIASRLLMHAPPCEFNEVFTDVRVLVNDDNLLQERVSGTFAQYNKDQYIQVKVDGTEHLTLITQHGDVGGGRFLCPRTHQTFRFDHLKREATEFRPAPPDNKANGGGDSSSEELRVAVEKAVTAYVDEYYRGGACVVYAPSMDSGRRVVVCIESHYCKNQMSGRWRSEWIINIEGSASSGTAEIKGVVKVQTHLYENGNIQLISSKDIEHTQRIQNPEQFSKDLISHMMADETAYQTGVGENFQSLSDTAFKALRRQLPPTRTKCDWNNMIAYKIGSNIASYNK